MPDNLLVARLNSVGTTSIPPSAAGIAGAFSRIGYRIEEALADLIDNSIDAKAEKVRVIFLRTDDRVTGALIVDDGIGMTEPGIDQAMQFGSDVDHEELDLGKFGMGLKSASLSQSNRFSVLSRADDGIKGRRWSRESLDSDWACEILDVSQCEELLNRSWSGIDLSQHGTIVWWEDLDQLEVTISDLSKSLTQVIKSIDVHLGITFHRFISDSRIEIIIDQWNTDEGGDGLPITVKPLDPFGYNDPGKEGYPVSFVLKLEGHLNLCLESHIWPRNSNEPAYRPGGGRGAASMQGFYFYRNDRLIQTGGWNGYRTDSEPHFSLARVRVELPIEFDSYFRLLVQKDRLVLPLEFKYGLDRLKTGAKTWKNYLSDAEDAYRVNQGTPVEDFPIIPNLGISGGARKRIRDHLRGDVRVGDLRKIDFHWRRLAPDKVFDIKSDDGAILLNSRYRDSIAGGDDSGLNDATFVKSLLFWQLKRVFEWNQMSAARLKELADLNEFLLNALEITYE